MRLFRYAVILMALLTSSAFSTTVGLKVNGGASFGFKPGGAAYWGASAPAYHVEIYDQPSYGVLARETEGYWKGSQESSGYMVYYEGKAISKAKADFGSLGVYSYAWVSEKNSGLNNPSNYYDWATSASANAEFYDTWRVDVPDMVAGTVGTVSVNVHLDGSRTDNWRNHSSGLSLAFGDCSTGSYDGITSNVYAGDYVLTVAFKYGQNNYMQMGLTSENGSFNEFLGGGVASYVDFYNTATITGLTFNDASGRALSNYTMTTGSSHNYNAVPEPATLFGFGLPILMFGLGKLRGLRK